MSYLVYVTGSRHCVEKPVDWLEVELIVAYLAFTQVYAILIGIPCHKASISDSVLFNVKYRMAIRGKHSSGP